MEKKNGIYKMKKDWHSVLGNGGIGFLITHHKGDLFYGNIEKDLYWTKEKPLYKTFYYPFSGGYPMWERDYGKDNPDSHYFVDEFLEILYETDKPKEYYLGKKFSQYELDKILKDK